MLALPDVTLVCLTGKDKQKHEFAINESCKGIAFGDVKLVFDETINSIDKWNKAVIFELHKHIDTPWAILIHADGYIIHPDAWREEFLEYDYVGAPWPLPKDSYSYRTTRDEIVRVGNSVSLRSKRIMELPSQLNLPWRRYYGNTNEDGFLCVHNRYILEDNGIKFAPLHVAKYFSKEHEIPENKDIKTFAFHQVD